MGGAAISRGLAGAALAAMLASTAQGRDLNRPRLIGVVIGAQTREAVIADGPTDRRPTVVEDGAVIAGFVVEIVDFETVVLVGPSGGATLKLEGAPDAQSNPVFVPEPVPNAGGSIGLLAIGRDACAHAGLLPGVRSDTEARLRQLIGADSKDSRPSGGEIRRLAPPTQILAGMAAAMADVHARLAEFTADRAECSGLEAKWKMAAGRYGLL